MTRFKATIVPKVLKQSAFKGMPMGKASQYDVDEHTAKQLHDRINATEIPLVYNHTERLVVGRVIRASMTPNGGMDMEAETDDATVEGQMASGWIRGGKLKAVSLCHMSVVNKPLEVSFCWEGARGPEAKCHSVWDSNTESYIPINAEPNVIAASLTSTELDEVLDFFTLSSITEMPETVAASADAPMTPPPAAAPAAEPPVATAPVVPPEDSLSKFKALSSNAIPSKQQKVELQLGAVEMALALAEMKKERESYKEQLAELAAIKDAQKKKKEEEENKKKELQRKVVGDFQMTYATSDEERKAVPDNVAKMTDDQLSVLYESATRVKASMFASMQTKEEELQQRSEQAIREYMQTKNIQTFQPPSTQQPPQTIAASAGGDSPYQSWLGKQHNQQLATNQVLFSELYKDESVWGVPQEVPPQHIIVAASAQFPQYNKPRKAGAQPKVVPWLPGQGLNFNWSVLNPGQAALYALHGKVDMMEGGDRNIKWKDMYSDTAIKTAATWRKNGGAEYERVMASKVSWCSEGAGVQDLPAHLNDGHGGMDWLTQQMRRGF